jgi:hypothetical protein
MPNRVTKLFSQSSIKCTVQKRQKSTSQNKRLAEREDRGVQEGFCWLQDGQRDGQQAPGPAQAGEHRNCTTVIIPHLEHVTT